jgi:hypothetical protein
MLKVRYAEEWGRRYHKGTATHPTYHSSGTKFRDKESKQETSENLALRLVDYFYTEVMCARIT